MLFKFWGFSGLVHLTDGQEQMIRHSDEIDGLRIPRRWVGDVEQLIEVEGGVEGAVCRHGGDGPGECSTVPSRISICVSAFDLQIEMK